MIESKWSLLIILPSITNIVSVKIPATTCLKSTPISNLKNKNKIQNKNKNKNKNSMWVSLEAEDEEDNVLVGLMGQNF